MTRFFHLVGEHGVGKTSLAKHLVENYQKYGTKAISLVESGHQVDDAPPTKQLRTHPLLKDYSVIFVEHLSLPADIDAQPGDLIIRIERAA